MHWIYAHLIGDYLIQNDWMAKEKKNSHFVCTVHILTYMVPFLFCQLTWWQFLLVAIQHWIQDRTHIVGWFMSKSGKQSFLKDMGPWSAILTDNIIHILWMALILK